VLSAVAAVAAAVIAVNQTHVAHEQSDSAALLSLSGLVSDISEQSSLLAKASDQSTEEAIRNTRLADAEEALVLVERLPNGIPAIDSYEMGGAFQAEDDNPHALASYERAVRDANDPHIRSSALRAVAALLFQQPHRADQRRAREDMSAAYAAYAGQPYVSVTAVRANEAFTDEFDVGHGPSLSCSQSPQAVAALTRARRELREAKVVYGELRRVGIDPENTVVREEAERAMPNCR
jgi:hypothetical protein